MTNEELSDLIGAIYDCVVEPEKRLDAMDAIARLRRFMCCGIVLFDLQQSRHRILRQVGIDPYLEARQPAYVDDMTRLYKAAPNVPVQSLDEPLVLSGDLPREVWANTRLFQEWAEPRGMGDTLQTIVLRDAGRIGVFAGHRHESEGTATDADVEMLRLLAPHIRRGVTISDFMDLNALERQALVATLDNAAAGVVIVGADGRILHANKSAERMFAAGGALHAVNSRLTARNGSNDALAQALAIAGRDDAEIGATGIGVALKSQVGQPMVAHVLPLAHGDLRARLMPQATAAVFLTDAAGPMTVPVAAIADSLGLTAAEAHLLERLAAGSTIASAAVALGIAETTAKTHLTHIFAKIDVSRQADLVALVHRLAPPVRRPATTD